MFPRCVAAVSAFALAASLASSGAPLAGVELPRIVPYADPGGPADAGSRSGDRFWGESARPSACVEETILCGTSRSGALTPDDCFGEGVYLDEWVFAGTAGMSVTIDLTSSSFDTLLFLADPDFIDFYSDDDGGAGTNSRIQRVLDETGSWNIGATSYQTMTLGSYTLTLQCSGGGVPAAPSNLTAEATSSTEVLLVWQDNSSDETAFYAEYRRPGNSFVEIGSVPAGTTAATVGPLLPDTTYEFRVRARNANGFSAYSNVASVHTLGGGGGSCVSDATTLCLDAHGHRWKATMTWSRGAQGGVALAVPLEDSGITQGGAFAFNNVTNPEVLLKILDFCALGGSSYAVFFAATTDAGFTLRVQDVQDGTVELYTNAELHPADPVQDSATAFLCP